jgi:hypothetical protein
MVQVTLYMSRGFQRGLQLSTVGSGTWNPVWVVLVELLYDG